MEEQQQTPEELIRGMNPDEICELLEDMGITVNVSQAVAIQGLINRHGSMEAAFEALGDQDSSGDRAVA